jgi:membrane protein
VKNRRVRGAIAIVEIILERMEENHVFLLAAGLAFNILLYLVPLMLVAVYIINLSFDVDYLANVMVQAIKEVLPPNPTTTEVLEQAVREVYVILGNSSIAGLIGLISLLWVSSTLFSSLRSGLNLVYNLPLPKIFVVYKIKDIFLTIILALLVFISSYAFPVLTIITSYLKQYMHPPLDVIFSWVSVTFISLLISTLMFYFLFRFVPNKRMPSYIINLSTLLSVVTVEISRNIFAWYLSKVAQFGKFYGTYAVIISLAIWIYYLMLIILFCAEISQFAYEHREWKRAASAPPPSRSLPIEEPKRKPQPPAPKPVKKQPAGKPQSKKR